MGFTPLLTRIVGPRRLNYWIMPLIILVVGVGKVPTNGAGQIAIAQVLPDSTLPTNSAVLDNGAVSNITGGTVSGDYLFHSFETFSVLEGRTVAFDNATSIESIITRVTGDAESSINGTIEAQGRADFLLLNPNGIVFGSNAQLNIGGSFIGSSAESIFFDDGGVFSAVNPQPPPLLTVNTSLGLQYGAFPGSLTVQGDGNNLVLDDDTLDVVLTDRPNGLQVSTGQTLALIGGNLSIEGGNVTAVSGQVILGSVLDGTVTLTDEGDGWSADYDQAILGNLLLSQAASVFTSGEGGGEIQLNGEFVRITGGSALLANTLGSENAVGITVQASELVRVHGAILGSDEEAVFPTSIFAEVGSDASGSGGSITLLSPRLRIAGGAQISASTLGRGAAGDISVVADRVNIVSGAGTETPSGLFVNVLNADTLGAGGDLSITAQQLNITGGAEIAASTNGMGDAGTINLEVDEVNLIAGAPGLGSSGIFAQVDSEAMGNGGSIFIESDRIQVTGGAVIEVTTFSSGSGGTLKIVADNIVLDGQSPGGIPAAISAIVNNEASGQGGSISINTQQIDISNGAQLTTATRGKGNAGVLQLNANTITLKGGDDLETVISSAVEETAPDEVRATGQGGTLAITTDTLNLMDGAQITTGTAGDGRAGELTIQAQTIDIEGRNNLARSGIVAIAVVGEGAGGSLTIDTENLMLRDGGLVTASNFSTTNNRAGGQGPAGNIRIQANRVDLEGGDINASTSVGDQGNIVLNSALVLLSDRSAITTNAAGSDGGDINISTENLVAFNNSDITANADQGIGGRVGITANGIFGIQFRDSLTPQSDITVTSSLGPKFDGVVELNTPDVDPLQGIVELPNILLDPNTEVIAACEQFRGNELIITGRGGLPAAPAQYTTSPTIWPDLRLSEDIQAESHIEEQRMAIVSPQVSNSSVLEAHTWSVDDHGSVTLMASPYVGHRPHSTSTMTNCY